MVRRNLIGSSFLRPATECRTLASKPYRFEARIPSQRILQHHGRSLHKNLSLHCDGMLCATSPGLSVCSVVPVNSENVKVACASGVANAFPLEQEQVVPDCQSVLRLVVACIESPTPPSLKRLIPGSTWHCHFNTTHNASVQRIVVSSLNRKYGVYHDAEAPVHIDSAGLYLSVLHVPVCEARTRPCRKRARQASIDVRLRRCLRAQRSTTLPPRSSLRRLHQPTTLYSPTRPEMG